LVGRRCSEKRGTSGDEGTSDEVTQIQTRRDRKLVHSHRNGRMRKGGFEVLRLLPETAGSHQYRVRSKDDGHEWVVMETELA
jgi:hypothetical protein